MTQRAVVELLYRGFVVACRGAKHRGRVAQLAACDKLAVVSNSCALDEPAQGVRGLVALETRQHCRRHPQDEELGTEQIGGELDGLLGICLRGGQIAAAYCKV